MIDESQVFAQIGEDGFARLVRSFYRQVPDDPVLGPMYPVDDLAGAEERLRDFLVGRFGGAERGQPDDRGLREPLGRIGRARFVGVRLTHRGE